MARNWKTFFLGGGQQEFLTPPPPQIFFLAILSDFEEKISFQYFFLGGVKKNFAPPPKKFSPFHGISKRFFGGEWGQKKFWPPPKKNFEENFFFEIPWNGEKIENIFFLGGGAEIFWPPLKKKI